MPAIVLPATERFASAGSRTSLPTAAMRLNSTTTVDVLDELIARCCDARGKAGLPEERRTVAKKPLRCPSPARAQLLGGAVEERERVLEFAREEIGARTVEELASPDQRLYSPASRHGSQDGIRRRTELDALAGAEERRP